MKNLDLFTPEDITQVDARKIEPPTPEKVDPRDATDPIGKYAVTFHMGKGKHTTVLLYARSIEGARLSAGKYLFTGRYESSTSRLATPHDLGCVPINDGAGGLTWS